VAGGALVASIRSAFLERLVDLFPDVGVAGRVRRKIVHRVARDKCVVLQRRSAMLGSRCALTSAGSSCGMSSVPRPESDRSVAENDAVVVENTTATDVGSCDDPSTVVDFMRKKEHNMHRK